MFKENKDNVLAIVVAFIMFFAFVDFVNPSKLDYVLMAVYSTCSLLLVTRSITFLLKKKMYSNC
ncbi:hypothetical protein [Viridibacillus arvi]|uniref:hypothetical protein n=1 Tax=Viridibacillus arvi TaxID=263475 RepID=UPI0034D0100F